MNVERLLQINIAVLTSLGTLLLGMGERQAVLPVLAVIVAASSVYLTDARGWLQLNTLVANIAGLIALALTVRDWNGYAAESQLLALANLLIYLQFVLHYRKKNVRNYWLLLLLSLLQVAVASALNLNIVFGMLLPVYLFIGLATMALFVLYREQAKYAEPRWPAAPGAATRGGSAIGEPVPPTARRWPLADRTASFSGVQPAGGIESGLTWSLWRQIAAIAAATVVLSMIWFIGWPRLGKRSPWRPRGSSAYTAIAFNENVTLGELGEVSENPEEVMQVRFFDFDGGTQGDVYRVAGDTALFRGGSLERYRRGEWQRRARDYEGTKALDLFNPADIPPDVQLVKEEILLRPRNDAVLFSVIPAFQAGQFQLKCTTETAQISRRNSETDKSWDYALITTGFRDHVPVYAVPASKRPDPQHLRDLLDMPYRTAQRDPLIGLRSVAAEVVGHLPPGQREQIARVLESYLRDSGRFQYSLKPIRRDVALDPLEDFITLHPSGHCEYFASALTLMLRSRGAPARMAIGYKGGQWNSAGRFYAVQELHAHTWVEAYLAPHQLPTGLKNDPQARQHGAWLILDPTPGQHEADRLAGVFGGYTLRQLLDLTQFVWTTYVLGLDSKRQQEAIFEPLVERIEQTLRDLSDEEQRRLIFQQFGQALHDRFATAERGGWYWLLVAMLTLLALVVAYVVLRPLARRAWHSWNARASRERVSRPRVEFFEQFELLLARHGMRRLPHQTQREFALASGGQLAETPATRPVAFLPRRIVEAYYRVRFGRRDLDSAELQAVQQALSALTDALKVQGAHEGPGFRVQGSGRAGVVPPRTHG